MQQFRRYGSCRLAVPWAGALREHWRGRYPARQGQVEADFRGRVVLVEPIVDMSNLQR
jgi:hypothetical protein